MAIKIIAANPGNPDFVAEVSGVDLRAPVSDADVQAIEAGMDRYAVLVFRDQAIDDSQQLAFTRRLGPLEPAYGVPGDTSQQGRLRSEINDISNLDRDNKIWARDNRHRLYQLGNMLWHSDSSYKTTPAKYSLLSAKAIPDHGGNTQFADMRGAWDALDPQTRELVRDLVCEHSRLFSRAKLGFEFEPEERAKFAPVPHRLVRRHPVTGRLSLYLSAHAGTILGDWPLPEARALLRELNEHATQREFVYSHAWRVNDLVMWDNRVTMHRGLRYPSDQKRDLRRTTTTDSAPTLEQPG
jgi:alpha-ketoglutarate-dependent 2,4-dichlorophenoxyacetate dioxygenase